MTKSIVHHITDALPADAICDRLGVKPRSVRAAREQGRFPASWYDEIDRMCSEVGIDCPRDAFNFKSPASASEKEAS